MKAKETKTKLYHIKNILIWIRPYLSDITNNHKTPKNLKVYSNKEVID